MKHTNGIYWRNMFVIRKALTVILIFSILISSGCSNISNFSSNLKNKKVTEEDLSKYFTGYEGCFVLFDKNKNEYVIYNQPKSKKQVSPCSTFKIVNSLIGLETKVLEDENTTFKWNGTKYPIESWNKDQTLKTAVSNSAVWYFVYIVSQVGEEKMQDYLTKFNYGNKDISGGLTKFWLQSSLKISPMEQVDVLRKFYDYQLPASKKNVDIVKNVITLSNENGIKLSGKTGSGGSSISDKYINGWFVGYVEKDKNVYIFATNIETTNSSDKNAGGWVAKEITLKILKDKKLYQHNFLKNVTATNPLYMCDYAYRLMRFIAFKGYKVAVFQR